NLCAPPPALAYRIEPFASCGRVVWLGPVDVSAEDLLARTSERRGPKGESLEGAKAFLQEALADGEKEQGWLRKQAKGLGVSERTLGRAKKELKVRSRKEGFSPTKWFWSLPDPGHENNLASFDENPQILETVARKLTFHPRAW